MTARRALWALAAIALAACGNRAEAPSSPAEPPAEEASPEAPAEAPPSPPEAPAFEPLVLDGPGAPWTRVTYAVGPWQGYTWNGFRPIAPDRVGDIERHVLVEAGGGETERRWASYPQARRLRGWLEHQTIDAERLDGHLIMLNFHHGEGQAYLERVDGPVALHTNGNITDPELQRRVRAVGGRYEIGILSEARGFTNEGLRFAASIPGLRALWIQHTGIDDAGLALLRGRSDLRELHLLGCNIGDQGLAHLRGLTRLRGLDLSMTHVSDEGLAHLDGMAELERLHLFNVQATETGLLRLARFSHLRDLGLGNLPVTEAVLTAFRELRLRRLDLRGTSTRDDWLEHVLVHTDLEELSLSATEVTDEGLARLRALPRLRELHLERNDQVTDRTLRVLASIPSLRVVRVGYSGVTPAGARGIRARRPDLRVVLDPL